MRCSMLVVVGGMLLVGSQAFGQGRPADLPGGAPIDDPSRRSQPLEPIPQGRQPGWIDQNAVPAGSQLEPQTTPPDLRGQVSPSAPEIRSYVANLTNAALSQDGLHKTAAMLSDADRQRLDRDMHPDDIRAYDDLVQRFRAQWKTRYGEGFDLGKQRAVIASYYVLRGPQAEDPITVGGTLPPSQGQTSPAPPALPASPAPAPQPDGQAAQAPSAARAGSERVATMIVPPNPDAQQPAMMLQFRNEGKPANWHLATPQSLTGNRLRENLTSRMQKLLDGQAKWPADPHEAYRLMSYHVLASLADQPVDRPKQNQPPGPAAPGNPSLES